MTGIRNIKIGLDSIEISRFAHWSKYSPKTLSKLFHSEEIKYCLSNPAKSAERFAARFAAKEAFYKAFCSINKSFSFLLVCKNIRVEHDRKSGSPMLIVNWSGQIGPLAANLEQGGLETYPRNTSLTITHTRQTATALVLIE